MSKSMERTIAALEKAGIGVECKAKDGEIREFLMCDDRWRIWPDVKQAVNLITNKVERYETDKDLVDIIKGKKQGK